MGGEKEFKTASKKSNTSKGEDQIIGELRIHENKGNIHFHDDTNKLKCSVPVATWYKAWERIWGTVGSDFKFIDVKNSTRLIAKVMIINRPHDNAKTELEISVDEVEAGPTLTSMIKFMEE